MHEQYREQVSALVNTFVPVGVVGCALAHYKAMQLAAQLFEQHPNYEYMLIVEDDVVPLQTHMNITLEKQLQQSFKTFPTQDGYHVGYLSPTLTKLHSAEQKPRYGSWKSSRMHLGFQALLHTRAGLAHIMPYMKVSYHIDVKLALLTLFKKVKTASYDLPLFAESLDAQASSQLQTNNQYRVDHPVLLHVFQSSFLRLHKTQLHAMGVMAMLNAAVVSIAAIAYFCNKNNRNGLIVLLTQLSLFAVTLSWALLQPNHIKTMALTVGITSALTLGALIVPCPRRKTSKLLKNDTMHTPSS